jgi:hypothetical protein
MPTRPAQGGNNGTWGADLEACFANFLDANSNIRVPNATWIKGRNAANNADVNLVQIDSTDKILLGTRAETNGYLSEANTTALRGLFGGFATRYGAGTISDRTMGIFTNVLDSASVARVAITNVANNGGGLFRVTATSHGFNTGDRVLIYGAGGVPNACNAWTITRIDANNFDLQGSTFAGAYTSGGFATTGGQIYGAQFSVGPIVTRDFGVSGGNGAFGDDVIGCAVYNGGTTKGTSAFNAGSNTGAGAAWLYGLTMDGGYDTGITYSGALTNFGIDFHNATSFGVGLIRFKNNVWVVGRNNANNANLNLLRTSTDDRVEFGVGIKMGAGITLGIDLSGGSFATAAIKLPNNNFITARNNANSADLSILGLDTTDSAAFNVAIRASGGLIVANTKNIDFSTSTGTMIATTTGQKFSFHGATPVIQRAGAAQAAVAGTASTQTTPWGFSTQAQADAIVTLVNELRAALVEKGLIKGAA